MTSVWTNNYLGSVETADYFSTVESEDYIGCEDVFSDYEAILDVLDYLASVSKHTTTYAAYVVLDETNSALLEENGTEIEDESG